MHQRIWPIGSRAAPPAHASDRRPEGRCSPSDLVELRLMTRVGRWLGGVWRQFDRWMKQYDDRFAAAIADRGLWRRVRRRPAQSRPDSVIGRRERPDKDARGL